VEARRSVVARYGLPGTGKTTLAVAFAEQHRADYLAIWWVRCESELTLRSDMT
jgi:ATP-dependent 26S proteasome regulatory subunit